MKRSNPSNPQQLRQPPAHRWRTEYARLYAVAEEVKQAAAAWQEVSRTITMFNTMLAR